MNKQNEDKILSMFFEPERWQYAISKGVLKDIRKSDLYQLTKPEVRIRIYEAIRDGKYRISPPHTAQIPKDTPGEFRTVYVNEPIDRIVLSIANDLLFELCPEMIHPRCKSYQKGIGCGKVVKEISAKICETEGEIKGWKADFSKYFDSVPLRFIDGVFDEVEAKHGKSTDSMSNLYLRKHKHCGGAKPIIKHYESNRSTEIPFQPGIPRTRLNGREREDNADKVVHILQRPACSIEAQSPRDSYSGKPQMDEQRVRRIVCVRLMICGRDLPAYRYKPIKSSKYGERPLHKTLGPDQRG